MQVWVRRTKLIARGGANHCEPPIFATNRILNLLDKPTHIETGLTPEEFRAAMRHFPAAVHVATTDGPSGRRGVTISSATSVSDKPATILICLHRDHVHNRLFVENGCFALNTLSQAQAGVSKAFANGKLTSDERFASAQWGKLITGAPIMSGAAVAFDCEIADIAEVETHTVIFGRVKALHINDGLAPLLYANRRYHLLGAALD
jgi:cob(II)yrinic acid a,c-diamide reductase